MPMQLKAPAQTCLSTITKALDNLARRTTPGMLQKKDSYPERVCHFIVESVVQRFQRSDG